MCSPFIDVSTSHVRVKFTFANPTHMCLSKMAERSVENANEIRADIKTRPLLSRGSKDIYADISTVYVIYLTFSTVCRRVGKFSTGVQVISAPQKYTHVRMARKLLKRFLRYDQKLFMNVQ